MEKRKAKKRKAETGEINNTCNEHKGMKTELENRTKNFTVAIIKLVRTFPKTVDGIELGRQLIRAASSIGANYREANRAESKNDFIHKVGIAEKEASETAYWLEICMAVQLGKLDEGSTLFKEANELLAITNTIGRKAKNSRLRNPTVASLVLFFSLSAFNFIS